MSTHSNTTEWRRTTKGWETVESWNALNPQLGPPPAAANVHPVIVAILQTLISIGALLLFEQTDKTYSPAENE